MREFLIKNKQIVDKDLITVIIPTLLKSDEKVFHLTLRQLQKSPLVKKIVIIDNTEDKRMKLVDGVDKMLIIQDAENLYVNPAWNRGIKEADTPYYLLTNDDVLLDASVLNECVNALEIYDVVAIDRSKYTIEDYFFSVPRHNEIVKAVPYLYWTSGCFILGKKETWEDIPDGLRIFWGDWWIFNKNMRHLGLVISTFISHEGQATVSRENRYSDGTLDAEKAIFQSLTAVESGVTKEKVVREA